MTFKHKTVFCIAGFLAVSCLCKHLNDNFDTKDLMSPEKAGSSFDTSSYHTSLDIQAILSQKFSFLGKGHQAFAFVSEDGEYVLKLFKPHYPHIEFCNTSFNFTYIPFAKIFYRLFAKDSFQKHLQEDLTSYINAFSSFQKESLVEYLHLTHTSNLKTMLKVFDKRGVLREIQADSNCFLIQRRVTLLPEKMQQLAKEKNTQGAKTLLQGLLELLSKRIELGFYKPTHKFHANFGCIGLQPIQLDIGRLLTKEDLQLNFSLKKESQLENSLCKLRLWIHTTYPEFESILEELITRV